MIKAYQSCRVCGVQVPAGFTNCDSCYHNTDSSKAEMIKQLHAFSKSKKPVPALVPSSMSVKSKGN